MLHEDKSKEKERTSNLWRIVGTILHSDAASVERIYIHGATVLEVVCVVGLMIVLLHIQACCVKESRMLMQSKFREVEWSSLFLA